jgi:outer membrane protein assembly factor BamD
MVRSKFRSAAMVAAFTVLLLISCGCFRKHKYENPITKDTQQPDKVLYDSAVEDIEHGRYERSRLTLQTLMNTYDTSEYLAKAKLAVADSWYREGGAHGFAQAEAEYKDFILFYPSMEEAAEAQEKVCKMQYQQMDRSDRDPLHALRAEDECKQLLVQFPNSKFAPEAQQLLRNIQEVLADAEFKVGAFYRTKGSFPAAANRLRALTDQFPLYSHADDALWSLADSYQRMGDRFENQQAEAYAKLVREYPLSDHVDAAKTALTAMNRPVPAPDPVAEARMKYERENRTKQGMLAGVFGVFGTHPDTTAAAKSGTPQMQGLRPTVPVSIPASAAGSLGVSADVSAAIATDSSALDKNPDARANPPAGGAAAGTGTGTEQTAAAVPDNTPPPTNHPFKPKKAKKVKAAKKNAKPVPAAAPAQPVAAPAQPAAGPGQPAAASGGAPAGTPQP